MALWDKAGPKVRCAGSRVPMMPPTRRSSWPGCGSTTSCRESFGRPCCSPGSCCKAWAWHFSSSSSSRSPLRWMSMRRRLASQWRLAADQVLEPGGAFSFTTLSEPTFLLGVEPSPSSSPWELRSIGDECIMEATRPLLQQMKRDVQRWEGVIRSACEETVATGRGRRYTVLRGVGAFAYGAPKEWRLRLLGASARVFVVDPQSPRLADDAKAQCSFVQALQNFSERESGRHHGVLRAVRISILGLLLVALIFAGLVFSRFFFYVAGDKLLRWWRSSSARTCRSRWPWWPSSTAGTRWAACGARCAFSMRRTVGTGIPSAGKICC
ncbi:unnamed protein product [Effrenium voratum]|nr:unnamed protein product [Effrenium voratum]